MPTLNFARRRGAAREEIVLPSIVAEPPDGGSAGQLVEDADGALATEAGQARHHPAVRALGAASEIADQVPSLVACGAVLTAGLVGGRPKLARAGGHMLASVLVAAVLKSAVKTLVSRTRPHAVLDGDDYAFEVRGKQGPDDHSFPSGHTAGAVAIARALGRVYPETAVLAYVAATAIALVQLPRGKHYPADLAAGAVIGIAADLIAATGVRSLEDVVGRADPPVQGECET